MMRRYCICVFPLVLSALWLWGCHRASAPGETDTGDTSVIDTSAQSVSTDKTTDVTRDPITDAPTDDVTAPPAKDVTGNESDMPSPTDAPVDTALEIDTESETGSVAGGCGNAILDPGEDCDDGDFESGDGCSKDCQLEPGYDCVRENSICVPFPLPRCGDGIARPDLGEACDDGNTKSGDGCEADCSAVEAGFDCSGRSHECVPLEAECGDGFLDWNEACDDGNAKGDDGCGADCMTEPGYDCRFVGMACLPVCGDGIVTPAEYCDDGNTDDEDACNSLCKFTDPSECKREIDYNEDAAGVKTENCVTVECGNGIVEVGEACDLGSDNRSDGYGCTDDCQFGSLCGDGRVDVDAGEQCDFGYDRNSGVYGGCTPNCTHAPYCGDGKVHSEYGERCDAGTELNLGNYGECAQDCTMGPYCGDGIVQEEYEDCDEGNNQVNDGYPGDTCYNSCQRFPW